MLSISLYLWLSQKFLNATRSRGLYRETCQCSHYSLCFTRLPFTSLPSSITSFLCLHKKSECSVNLATYSKSSVKTDGQLSFKYSKPSVCITAEETKGAKYFSRSLGHQKYTWLWIINNALFLIRGLQQCIVFYYSVT